MMCLQSLPSQFVACETDKMKENMEMASLLGKEDTLPRHVTETTNNQRNWTTVEVRLR